jgi:tetratricopeptide (TPR) repeat protein
MKSDTEKAIERARQNYRKTFETYEVITYPMKTHTAEAQTKLGNALQRLGERESGTARLEEAVTAYRAALEVRTRPDTPTYWATDLNNLAMTLKTIGEREKSTRRVQEARSAVLDALEIDPTDETVRDTLKQIDAAIAKMKSPRLLEGPDATAAR